ncbi:hypothetical protein E1B28_010727 [Marasmius oreades]|uniref:Uncharacterized protein n=1 Tax=Marasmius oreades TaxID=181124 RepID=A0A9P7URC3_9AGAR|nr:uncharacterized protein E1B28_010727 [Marasmius oreades]KAG7089014.1 hypothetical protein E1B28_010727 [Marasmius oreades]
MAFTRSRANSTSSYNTVLDDFQPSPLGIKLAQPRERPLKSRVMASSCADSVVPSGMEKPRRSERLEGGRTHRVSPPRGLPKARPVVLLRTQAEMALKYSEKPKPSSLSSSKLPLSVPNLPDGHTALVKKAQVAFPTKGSNASSQSALETLTIVERLENELKLMKEKVCHVEVEHQRVLQKSSAASLLKDQEIKELKAELHKSSMDVLFFSRMADSYKASYFELLTGKKSRVSSSLDDDTESNMDKEGEMDIDEASPLFYRVSTVYENESGDQQTLRDNDEGGTPVDEADEDVELRRPTKRRKVDRMTIEDQLTDVLDPVSGQYQTIAPDNSKSSHIIFTVFASDHDSLVIHAPVRLRASQTQNRTNISSYDLGKEVGFLLFLNDQLGLRIPKNELSLLSPMELVAKVYLVDVASQTSDEIDAFLKGLTLQDEGCILRLSDSCGMQIGLPVRTNMRAAPIWIEPVPKKMAHSAIEKAVKNSLVQVESLQGCRRVEGTETMRGHIHWRGDASGVLWDLLWGGKTVAVQFGKKKGEISRMEFCPFCSYDCMGQAWPPIESCSTLRSLEDFELFEFKDVVPPTSTSSASRIVVPKKPDLRLRQNHDSAGRRRRDREKK